MSSNGGGLARFSLHLFRLCMVRSFLSVDTYTAMTDRSIVEDILAFLIVVYTAKRQRVMRLDGMPSLLDNIVEGATTYFLVIFTGHLLLILFELFAPVSTRLLSMCSFAYYKLHIGPDSASSSGVSHRFGFCDRDKFNSVLSRVQREFDVSIVYQVGSCIFG